MISYETLLSALDLPSIPALEDLLIEGIYASIFSGRLDQKEARVEIVSSIGRDVRPVPPPSAPAPAHGLPTIGGAPLTSEINSHVAMDLDLPSGSSSGSNPVATHSLASPSIPSLSHALKDWLLTISSLLHSLDHKINALTVESINAREYKVEHEKIVTSLVADHAGGKGKERQAQGPGQEQVSGSGGGGWDRNRDQKGEKEKLEKDLKQARIAKNRGGGEGDKTSGAGASTFAPVGGGDDEAMDVDAGGNAAGGNEAGSPGKGRPLRKRGRN